MDMDAIDTAELGPSRAAAAPAAAEAGSMATSRPMLAERHALEEADAAQAAVLQGTHAAEGAAATKPDGMGSEARCALVALGHGHRTCCTNVLGSVGCRDASNRRKKAPRVPG
jgi:hypothetical protein